MDVAGSNGSRSRALWQAGREAWPDLDLPEPLFASYLSERAQADAARAADLYLACACAHEVPGAVDAFERGFLRRVPIYLSRMRLSPSFIDELQQVLRERLFVAPVASRRKIREYGGRGSLEAWLQVVATRTALNLRRVGAALVGWDAVERVLSGGEDQERDHLKDRHREDFMAAFRAALAALTDRQRQILYLYYARGQTMERIGEGLGLHHSTIVRAARDARRLLQSETARHLRERLRVSESESESIIQMVQSRIDLSLSGLLAVEEEGGG